MPYFINRTELNWGAKIGYVWAGSNAVTFSKPDASHKSSHSQTPFSLQKANILTNRRPPLHIVFLYFFLPEMRNRTLEEIDELFQERVSTRQFPKYQCVSTERAREQVIQNIKMQEEDARVAHEEKALGVEHRELKL